MGRAAPMTEDQARALVEVCDGFSALVVAVIGLDGTLQTANKGFRDLTGIPMPPEGGADARGYFVQPRFERLVGDDRERLGIVFEGIVTLEDISGRCQSVRGVVAALGAGVVLVAEHDVGGYRELADSTLALNEELAQMQRQLLRTKLELERRQDALRELSITDELTGLKNRRYALERLEAERARVRRDGGTLSLLLLDVDDFKSVNDVYGHAVGDDALRGLAGVLRRCVREYDLVARIGGDEHLVLLPDTGLEEAVEVARSLHAACRGVGVADGQRHLTVSIGLTSLGDESSEACLRRADLALYTSKRQGRDRVTWLGADDRGVAPGHGSLQPPATDTADTGS